MRERWDERCQALMLSAKQYSQENQNYFFGTEHLLLAMLDSPDGLLARLLGGRRLDAAQVKQRAMTRLTPPSSTRPDGVPLTPRIRQIVMAAEMAAEAEGSAVIAESHLLDALLRGGRGVAVRVLEEFGWFDLSDEGSGSTQKIRSEKPVEELADPQERTVASRVRSTSPAQVVTPLVPPSINQVLVDFGVIKKSSAPSATPVLDRVGRDLTALAHAGTIGPIVCRRPHIEDVARALCRASRNNPLLVGEAGVGKSAIVEGVALAVATDAVPAQLFGVRLVEVPSGALQTETAAIIEEASTQHLILVVDGLQTLPPNLAVQLLSHLGRGHLRLIGTCSAAQYERLDADFARCFHRIFVEEPSEEESLEILRAVRDRFQRFHGVEVPDETLRCALELGRAHAEERRMPDAAVDLLDEACVRGVSMYESAERPVISPQTVAEVVAQWTGMSRSRVMAAQRSQISLMEEDIGKQVVGQPDAVARVCERMGMVKAGFREDKGPLASFLFVGPPGVGKGEMARALARYLFKSDTHIHRLDMAEYAAAADAARLTATLREAMQRNARSVLLLDEMERAHARVLEATRQMLESAELTQTVVVMTSTVWKDKPRPSDGMDVVRFHPLTADSVRSIAQSMVERWQQKSLAKGYPLEVSDDVVDLLCHHGYSEEQGARPMKRAIEQLIMLPLSREIVAGRVRIADLVVARADGDQVRFEQEETSSGS